MHTDAYHVVILLVATFGALHTNVASAMSSYRGSIDVQQCLPPFRASRRKPSFQHGLDGIRRAKYRNWSRPSSLDNKPFHAKRHTHTHILRLFCHLLSLEQKRALFSIHLQDPRAEKTPTRQARAEHRCRAPSGFAPRCRPRCCSESNTPESFPPIGTAEWGTWREKRGRGAADSSCGLRLLSSYTSSPTQPYPSLTPNPSLHKGGSRDWQGWPRNSAAFFGIWSDSLRFRTSVVLICLKIRARVLSYIPSRAQCGNQFLEEMVSNPQPERTARPKRRARPITDRGVPRGFLFAASGCNEALLPADAHVLRRLSRQPSGYERCRYQLSFKSGAGWCLSQ